MVGCGRLPEKAAKAEPSHGRRKKNTSFDAVRRAYLPPKVVNISPYVHDYTQPGAKLRP
jgi:hypothetical protein